MDYRQLLKKYINHVGAEEGTTFLAFKGGWEDSPEFTDEEWAELQKLEAEPLAISAATHSCSCHVKNAGPCPICKELGCVVWDFNYVAQPEIEANTITAHILKSDPLPNSSFIGVEFVQEPKKGCPSCDHDLSYPGQPGHICYTYAEWEANKRRNRERETPS